MQEGIDDLDLANNNLMEGASPLLPIFVSYPILKRLLMRVFQLLQKLVFLVLFV